MIVQCGKCNLYLDDEFRTTVCPHKAFNANDGANHFRVVEESYLGAARVERCTKTIVDHEVPFWSKKQCCKIAGHAGPHYTW